MREITKLTLLMSLMVVLAACDRLSVKKSLSGSNLVLTDQNGETVRFPDDFEGKVLLAGYIYTYCPDICPLVTLNMKEIQQQLDAYEREDIHFVGFTMDPDRDTPEVLSAYADRFGLDHQWTLLTGDRQEISRLMELVEVIARRTPTRFTEDGVPLYFIDHSDKVTLMDADGNIRRDYMGSTLAGEQVVSDIRSLLH